MSAVIRFAPVMAALAMAGCAELETVKEGEPDLLQATVEPMGGDRFSVTVSALNTDGYQLARCIAAGHVDTLRDEQGARLHDVFRREGGQLRDEFRVVDAVRTQTTSGFQTYAFDPELTVADHDGRDVMAVDLQLAGCEKAGLPTGAE